MFGDLDDRLDTSQSIVAYTTVFLALLKHSTMFTTEHQNCMCAHNGNATNVEFLFVYAKA